MRDRDEPLTLELLTAIEESSEVTQRHLAQRLGVALGLANSYLKRCVRKGLVKVQQAPANRYLYYLTPKGFVEKSRLTGEYLRVSLSFYRRASDSLASIFADCAEHGRTRAVLCGVSDMSEIAALRAAAVGIEIVAVHDAQADVARWAGCPVWREMPPLDLWDVCVVTDLVSPQETYQRLVEAVGVERVLVPDVLGINRRAETA